MRLSISSSNDRLPNDNWLIVWGGVIFLSVIAVLFSEWHIRHLGWSPSVVDSPDLWVEQRKRASKLGNKALILIGASRIQLDMDMQVLREKTGLEPIQLAIDGTSYIPVLEDLAQDPDITGTIFVSVNAYNMRKGESSDVSTQWVNYYKKTQQYELEPYRLINNKIVSFFNNISVLRLEGAKPYTVISQLAFQKKSMGNYLLTNVDRSRDADYSKVKMPQFYAARLQRHFGKPLLKQISSFEQFFTTYKKAISVLQPVENKQSFSKQLEHLLILSNKIEERGGKVVFIRFPTGKLVWEVDNKKYPKEIFWKEIEQRHQMSINFIDYSSLNHFTPPDGSHLDFHDKNEFTNALLDIFLAKNNLKSILPIDRVDARL